MSASLAIRALAATALLGPLLPAQEPTPATAAAWARFQSAVPGPWLVRWHGATGTPLEVFGRGYDLVDWRANSLTEARRHADVELHRWSELLGLGTSTFVERTGARMGRTWSFTYAQSHAGLPVIGGRADVRVHMRGRISFLGSTAVPIPKTFDGKPRITVEAATAIAWQDRGVTPTAVPQPGTAKKSRLVIWADHGSATPVGVVAGENWVWTQPITVNVVGTGAAVAALAEGVGRWIEHPNPHSCLSERQASTPPVCAST